jgi:hypothetical protein
VTFATGMSACLPPFIGSTGGWFTMLAYDLPPPPSEETVYIRRPALVFPRQPATRRYCWVRKRQPEFHVAAKRSYFHVHRGSMMRSRGAPKSGDQNMALREMRTAEHDQAVEELDREIREFVRHEVVSNPRRQPENESESVAININSLLQRVTATSLQEIDSLITELESSLDMLQSEAARVQREIFQYSTLSQTALQSTKIITESLTQLKKGSDAQTRFRG